MTSKKNQNMSSKNAIFNKIENALSKCKEHLHSLDKYDIKDAEVESYLVAGLVLLIASEYEEHIEEIFVKRVEKVGDSQVENYFKWFFSQKFRSPDMSKINETLKRFDVSLKESFWETLENSEAHTAWDAIMKARHAVVHKGGNLNLTFQELNARYPLTKNIIDKLEAVLLNDS